MTEMLIEYAKDVILIMGGNDADIEQITDEIREGGYTTVEEFNKHMNNYYTSEESTPKEVQNEKDTYWGAELCPHCGKENGFVWEEGTPRRIKCSECGTEMLLCSLCDMDSVDCSKCPYWGE
jgi:phage terminase large subunit GpA-like protein